MSSRRIVLLGGAALGVYLAVAVATLGLSGRHLLPLFEGIGPPPPYQWVNPPPAFAAGNTKPKPASADIAFTGGKSAQAATATPDGQCVVNFSAGAVADHGNDTIAHAAITPLDPATLGPVPAGLAADGNAYRIALSYQPSDTPLDSIAGPADVALTAPNPAHRLLYSGDGRSWSTLVSQSVGATSTVISTFTRTGWYLVAANPTAVPSGSHNNALGTATVAALVAGLAILLAAAPVGFRSLRRRSRRASAAAAPPDPPAAGPPARRRRR